MGRRTHLLRVRPLPVDIADRDELSARIHESEPSIPTALCTELAHMFLASGTATSTLELQHIMRFQVADLWDCICFPLAHSYVFVHGTDIPAGTSILHELLIRPHMPGASNEGSFPVYCFYGQCALGDLDLHNLKQAVDRQLRISKGFQGILIAGIVRTAKTHAKITWSDTTEEARLTYRRGVVRTPTRWTFHPAHAHIKAAIVPLPL